MPLRQGKASAKADMIMNKFIVRYSFLIDRHAGSRLTVPPPFYIIIIYQMVRSFGRKDRT